MGRTVITLIASLLLGACATRYGPNSYAHGGGWTDTRLAPNTFKVEFKANKHSAGNQATDMALLRSADLALSNGFAYFIVGSATDVPTDVPGGKSSGSHVSPSKSAAAPLPGQTYAGHSYVFDFPAPTMIISCFREKPVLDTPIFEAATVANSLRAQYSIP